MNRRRFLASCAAASAIAGLDLRAEQPRTAGPQSSTEGFASGSVVVPDEGWNLWIDRTAAWEDDTIYLPDDVDLTKLPTNAPTGGWESLYARNGGADYTTATLPATVEQYFWGAYGSRSYTPKEYRWAATDPVPQNGAYRGVSWWWREIEIPASMRGKRILLHVRGARMRAEVYLNGQLTGYSVIEELPFECDLTSAAKPGGVNRLAIRITNPGGRYDWVDGTTIRWGKVNVYRSHGFAGLDRELVVYAAPRSARIADAWVLNTPEPRTITAFAKVEGAPSGQVKFELLEPGSNKVLASANGEIPATPSEDGSHTVHASLSYKDARLWELATPVLYRLRATLPAGGESDVRMRTFGFRWFAPTGLGTNAIFQLNGRRIKLFSAISWGFWGMNGLWPTPALAEREVRQAQRLGLNCLNFHRNVGKEEVFRQHDRLGLLRYMEPGGGKFAIGRLPSGVAANAAGTVMQNPQDEADRFSRQFMLAKCRAMVRAFRSHPSLIQYTLQNEIGADLGNPETFVPLDEMHKEDPSRSVVLDDGFTAPPRRAPQAWYSPYDNTIHRSDQEPWAGWWNNHQGAGDQWYDEFYKGPDNFTYNQPLKTALVEFGEMEGCAVADNHALMVQQIETRAFGGHGTSYDLTDHKEILAAYNIFLDRWGFRGAFPTAADLFQSMGAKVYESWQQYLENVRICDALDFAVISGWESTAIENHSGIVDNLRNFKGDPDLIASSLKPVRPVAKQRKLCYAMGESAVFDLYLFNETGKPIGGKLRFSMSDPGGAVTQLGSWAAPAPVADQFSYTIETAVTTPAFAHEGVYRFQLTADGAPGADFTREVWVANAKPQFARPVTVGVSGLLAPLRDQLAALPGVTVSEFAPGAKYDLIAASGVIRGSKLDSAGIDETEAEEFPLRDAAPDTEPRGAIPDEVLAEVRAGTPLLAAVPVDSLADGVAKQLSVAGAFTYRGQVGDLRAPWMGNWLFVREHATFAGLPSNRTLGIHYQARGKQSNGLQIERASGASDPEVIMGYSRGHDRNIGAASFVCRLGSTPVLVHRAPAFSAPLQQRWLANAISYLSGIALA
ncbi:MAG: sugar-binding domain-containing protein [Terracidiphilus sp.]